MSEYDRRAEAWVRKHVPGANPEPGSVSFEMDSAAYNSDAWSNFDAIWTEKRQSRPWSDPVTIQCTESISASAWQYDVTDLIRELLDMDLDTEPEEKPCTP